MMSVDCTVFGRHLILDPFILLLSDCVPSVPYRNLINWSRAVFSPDDKHLLAGGHAGELFFWNVESGKLEAILAGVNLGDHSQYGGAPSPSASSPASSSAAAVAAANAISEQAISCVDWNRNGRQVMSCDHGGNIHVSATDRHTRRGRGRGQARVAADTGCKCGAALHVVACVGALLTRCVAVRCVGA